MSKKQAWEDLGAGTQQGGGNRYGGKEFKDFRLKFTASPEGNRYRLRFLDKALRYMAHYPEKFDPKTKDRKEVPFPDAETVSRLTRVCTDESAADENRPSHCPWCRLGYSVRPRYLINVVDYSDTDDDGDPTIKFVEFPKSAAQKLAEWYRNNKDECPGGPGDMDGEAPDFVVSVTGKPGGKGGPITYDISQKGNQKPLSDKIINAIKKINPNAQTEEQSMMLHDLDKLCRPSYMSGKMQIEKFGEIIDEVPFSERQQEGDDDQQAYSKGSPNTVEPEDDAPAVSSKPALTEEDEEDMDKIFGTTVHGGQQEDDDDDDGEFDEQKAKSEVKW